jgi:hypothetical protein
MTGYTTVDNRQVKVPVLKTKAPQMSNKNGRTWDKGTILLNGSEITVWLDTSWGFYIYFEVETQWYKMRMFGGQFGDNEYDIDPFANPKSSLEIKF